MTEFLVFKLRDYAYTEEKQMPYMTTPERVGLERGLIKGIKALLDVKFGDEGLKLLADIDELLDHEMLQAILEAIRKAPTLEGLRPELDALIRPGPVGRHRKGPTDRVRRGRFEASAGNPRTPRP